MFSEILNSDLLREMYDNFGKYWQFVADNFERVFDRVFDDSGTWKRKNQKSVDAFGYCFNLRVCCDILSGNSRKIK